MDTVEGVVEATTVGTLCVVVVFDAGQVAEALRVLVQVVTVPVDVAVVVVFWATKVLLELLDDEVVMMIDDELDEDEVDEVVGLGVSDTRLPVTLNIAAQAARSVPLGQHHV
jgi:hypothetical protein